MKIWKKELTAFLVSLVVLALLLGLLTRLMTPKGQDFGFSWDAYLQETPDSMDLLFCGSSLVYCDVVPAIIWEETGLTGYVTAGPEQTMPITELYLREALKTQSPQAVFVEVTGLFYARYTNYTKSNVGQMPWGRNRWKAIFQEAEPELRTGLIFPLYFYHDQWGSLSLENLRPADPDALAGYNYLNGYVPVESEYVRPMTLDRDNLERNWDCLMEIYELCLEEGIQPVFYLAPTWGRVPEEYMAPIRERLQALDRAVFLDCNRFFSDIGADPQRDFYDPLHYNVSGAAKFSAFLAGWIEENLELIPDHADQTPLWEERADRFHLLARDPLELREIP